MATKHPDADIFDDDDDDYAPKRGARPSKPTKHKVGGTSYIDDLADDLKDKLVKAPRKEFEKISLALSGLSQPGVSMAERMMLKRTIREANENLKKIEKENKSYVKLRQQFNTVKMDSGARLRTLRDFAKQGKFSEEQLKQMREMEKNLIESVQHSKLDAKDHKNNERVVKLLSKIEEQTSTMPDELRDKFNEIEERTAVIMSSQEQAMEVMKASHAKIASLGMGIAKMGGRLGMKVLDHIGLGPLTLGNAARGIGATYRGAKAVHRGFRAMSSYMEARRIISAGKQGQGTNTNLTIGNGQGIDPAPAHDVNDPTTRTRGRRLTSPVTNADTMAEVGADALETGTIPRRRGKDRQKRKARGSGSVAARQLGGESKHLENIEERGVKADQELNKILEAHTASIERFNNRLLAELRGRPKIQQAASGGSGVTDMLEKILTGLAGLAGLKFPGLPKLPGGGNKPSSPGKPGAPGEGGKPKPSGKPGTPKPGTPGIPEGAKPPGLPPAAAGSAALATGVVTAVAIGGAAASVFATEVVKNNKQLRDAFKPENDPYGMLSASSGDTGFAAAIFNAAEEGRAEREAAAAKAGPQKSRSASGKVLDLTSFSSSAGGGRGSMNPDTVAQHNQAVSVGGGRGNVSPDLVNGAKLSDVLGKTVTKSGGADVKGLNPQMSQNLAAMSKAYTDATGKKLNINSGFRSIAEQTKLYRTKPPGMAAKPGSSLHNYGLAVDISASQADELDKLGLLGKYGFTRPINNEKWHLQPAGISVSAARAGLYSADAPNDQGGFGGSGGGVVGQQSIPFVTSADFDAKPDLTMYSQGAGSTTAPAKSGGTAGGTKISASSIPTFDNSDGMFLALNTGII